MSLKTLPNAESDHVAEAAPYCVLCGNTGAMTTGEDELDECRDCHGDSKVAA